MTRCSGISVPLFSLVTSRGWGGRVPRPRAVRALDGGGGAVARQILPVMELPVDERSPYSALTSFALDPTGIALPRCRSSRTSVGNGPGRRRSARLARVRSAPAIRWAEVRDLKQRWLRRAWAVFRDSRQSAPERHDASRHSAASRLVAGRLRDLPGHPRRSAGPGLVGVARRPARGERRRGGARGAAGRRGGLSTLPAVDRARAVAPGPRVGAAASRPRRPAVR